MALDETDTSPEGRACRTIAARQAELLRDAPALDNLGGGGFDPGFRSYCVPAGGGRVWSHLLSDVRVVRGFVEARWSPVIAEPDRILAVGPGSPFKASDGASTSFYVFEGMEPPFLHFDFDGDGTDEFLHPLAETEHGSGGYSWISSVSWTFRDERVVRYAGAPEHVRLVRDVDRDGRPDLLYPGPYRGLFAWGNTCRPVFDAASAPDSVLFVAHSLVGGSFSTTDDVVAGALRDWCPAPPDFSHLDTEQAIGRAIACARARGATPGDLSALVAEACRRITPSCPGQRGCLNQTLFDEWIRALPPVELR